MYIEIKTIKREKRQKSCVKKEKKKKKKAGGRGDVSVKEAQ